MLKLVMLQRVKGFKKFGLFLTLLAVTLLVVLGGFLWSKQSLNNMPTLTGSWSEPITPDNRLDGTVSSLHVQEWGINLNFKDADKTTYKIPDSTGNYLELYVKDTFLPPGACGRLGVALHRTSTEQLDRESIKLGNRYYYKTGAPGFCDPNKEDDSQTVNLIKNIVGSGFDRGAYTITSEPAG